MPQSFVSLCDVSIHKHEHDESYQEAEKRRNLPESVPICTDFGPFSEMYRSLKLSSGNSGRRGGGIFRRRRGGVFFRGEGGSSLDKGSLFLLRGWGAGIRGCPRVLEEASPSS